MVIIRAQACVSQKTLKFCGFEMSVVKLQSAHLEKLAFNMFLTQEKSRKVRSLMA